MKGRGCANQTFTLKGNNFKYQQPNVTCFIEFAAAFDSINGALDNDRTRRSWLDLVFDAIIRFNNEIRVNCCGGRKRTLTSQNGDRTINASGI
ncbi:unnamed protein product [Dracunculus medinensis]|uniref:Reverse transcriptase domain-containing protein n=1 Tax=Dracunculus medinensis TaxID=318479 RepID=A0A0N4U3L7_DRAME|nr:unnamed protein product [Dracunculus medinensis]